MKQWVHPLWNDFPTWKVVLVHLPIVPSEEMEQWFHRQKTDSADRVREGIVRGTCGDTEYSLNILQNSPKGRICEFRGIEPLVQDMLQVQPVSSSEYSHVRQSVTRAPLYHLDTFVEQGPFQYVSMDLITDLPPSNKYDSILRSEERRVGKEC